MAGKFPSGNDALINEAWTTLQDANHKARACTLRAEELTKWVRLRDFISLGVTPGLLVLTTVWDNMLLRTLLFGFSGVCSLSVWLWFIFGSAYKWDNQLRVIVDSPPKLDELVVAIKENIEIFVNARKGGNTQVLEVVTDRLRTLIERVNSIRQDMHRDQVYAKPWMDLIATQDTMHTCEAKCGECYRMWIPGSKIFNSEQAKQFLRKAKKGKLSGVCEICGQRNNSLKP